jgi:ABC-2 type transport system ATP-binding protein
VLLHEPRVLVLDEPASDLDPRARIEMRDLLIELSALGKTIFLSSHILSELDDICTSVGIIEKGRLLVAGPIAEIGAGIRRSAPAAGAAVPGGEPGIRDAAEPASPEAVRHVVKIRVLGEAADHLPALRAHENIVSASAGAGGWLTVEHGRDETFVAELVRDLVRAGAGVVVVEPERAELERIFMQVTKGAGS